MPIAAGVGLTYELLTGDLSQVNYSSIRAGLIEFRRRMEALQWQLLVPGLCQPVWRRFVLAAQAAGKLPDGDIGADWTAPRFEAVDPMKDIQADILAVRAGVMTLKEAIARQGYEPAQVLAEIAAINAELDALGITLDTDPRRSTRTGQEKQHAGEAGCRRRPPDPDRGLAATVDLPLQTRADVRLMPESVDAERRTVELVWSTGAAVRRRDPWTGKRYDEVLSLEETHVDLSRLNGGAPLLNTHGAWDLRDVIGVVERAWIAREGEALVGRATVRFSDRADVEPIWRDVASGIVRNVSVGYAVRSYEITETDGQPPVWRAVDWQPLELSAVPVGADAAAGFRAAGQPAQPTEPATHPCHLLRRTPAPIPEEPTMTREAETETTPPEAAAAAAPAATRPPSRRRPRRRVPRPRRRRPAPSRPRRSRGRAGAGRAGAEPSRGRTPRPSAPGPRSGTGSPRSTTPRGSSASPARSPTISSPAASASMPPARR